MSGPLSQVARPLVKTVLGTAASIIKQKFQLLQGVEEDIKTLERKLTAIQSVLEYAEQKQLDQQPLRDWLGKLKEKAYDADDVLKTFATEAYLWQKKQQVQVLWPPFSASEIAFKIEAAQEIKHILEELDQILKDTEQFDLKLEDNRETLERNLNADVNRKTSEIGHVFGREDDKNKIVDMLLSEELDDIEGDISVLPIIGMGGLGKTTLAQVVFNDDRVKSHFEFRMWVSVTVNFDYRSILIEMVESHSEMKYDIKSLSDELLQSRLLEFLAQKRFLLVLDDVWIQCYDVWEKLQKVLNHGGKGCRVLITSRNTRVSYVMGTQPPHLLEYLPEDQCWSMFEKIAFKLQNIAGNVRRDLQDIGREIVRKCNGLPLAVKAMGGLLRGNTDVNKWQKILKNEIWEAEEPMVLPALKLSYDHLPSDLKQCFAYCYMFPKAYVFDKNELVKLWKAESFIHPKEGYTADETGSDYFDMLFMRSFFQLLNVDNKQRYMMHDLIHDLAHSVSRPHCYQVKDHESCQVSQSSRHVSLLCKDVEKPILEVIDKSKRLRTLLLPSEYLRAGSPYSPFRQSPKASIFLRPQDF